MPAEDVRIDGGAGNDRVTVTKGTRGALDISLGAGRDLLNLVATMDDATVSLGDGSDRIRFSLSLGGAATILDFSAATGGDSFELTGANRFFTGRVSGISSFLTGHLQLIQDGADTLFRIDRDGGGDEYVTAFVFKNVRGHELDPTNFAWHLDSIFGTSAAHTVLGTAASDHLWGFGGSDRLVGGEDADLMDGGAGNDTYVVDHRYNQVQEYAGRGVDRVEASVTCRLADQVENLVLTGSAATDGFGNDLDNVITGAAAGNLLDGRFGADTLRGGLGDDMYVVDNEEDLIRERPGEGRDAVHSSVSFTLAEHLEDLVLTGEDDVDGIGNALSNTIVGTSGSNLLDGGAGADQLRGGAGSDVYVVDSNGDVVAEVTYPGTDTVRSSVSYTLGLHLENLTLAGTGAINGAGNALDNVLIGNAAANRLDGRVGADILRGGAGDDTYVVDDSHDIVTEREGRGTDTVVSRVLDYVLAANVENLTMVGSTNSGTGNALENRIRGNEYDNRLDGAGGADILVGGGGYDLIMGEEGDDRLDGGKGVDRLNGGAGADGFQFSTALGTANVDTIQDFASAEDTIFLDRSVFQAITANGALAAASFQVGATARDGDDRILYDSVTGRIFYDADGSGSRAAVQFAQVSAGTRLDASDFRAYTAATAASASPQASGETLAATVFSAPDVDAFVTHGWAVMTDDALVGMPHIV